MLIIICACIPTLKPVYDRHFRRRGKQPRNPRLLLTMPTLHTVSETMDDGLLKDENNDRTTFPSSFPLSRSSNTTKGNDLGRYEPCGSDEAQVDDDQDHA